MRIRHRAKTVAVLFALTLVSLGLSDCLGKTTVRQTYFISPQKRNVFIASPVNYTDWYLLDDWIRSRVKEYFSSQPRFTVVENVGDSDLYILLHIRDYLKRDVNDYGFGNREINIKTRLFVSDSQYKKRHQKKEQYGRYYFNDFPLEVEVVDYLKPGDSYFTEERLEELALKKVAISIYELMLNGRVTSANQIQ